MKEFYFLFLTALAQIDIWDVPEPTKECFKLSQRDIEGILPTSGLREARENKKYLDYLGKLCGEYFRIKMKNCLIYSGVNSAK